MLMFGFKKRKEKERWMSEFTPSFGTADEFCAKYEQNDEAIVIGKSDDREIRVSISDGSVNKVVILNDSFTSVHKDVVAPILLKGNLSYIIYDEKGLHYDALAETMRSMGYDVQLIDLSDDDNASRINLFETVNITGNPHLLSVVLANSIQCDEQEVDVAYNLLMAMMHFVLSRSGVVDAKELDSLFRQIVTNDNEVMSELENCPGSREHIAQVYNVEADITESVIRKLSDSLFNSMVIKTTEPNVFAITMHHKKTATFIKRVPKQYSYLITALMLNLEESKTMCESNGVTTLIIDSSEEEWYHQDLLHRFHDEDDGVDASCCAIVAIKKKLCINENNDDRLLVYMHSEDSATNDFVYNVLKFKYYPSEERDECSKKYFRDKELPEEILNRAPITIDELKTMSDCLVIDVAHDIKPFRCDRLA